MGQGSARRVFDVFPGEAVAAGNDVVIEEDERLGRIDAQPFEIRRRAVAVDVVHAHEPGILGVGHCEPSAGALVFGVGTGHVVGNGPQVAGFGQVERALLVGDDVAPQQQTAILHAVDVLGHLALAAARMRPRASGSDWFS